MAAIHKVLRMVYVGHKAWICAIHGLPCAKRGSALCTWIGPGLSTHDEREELLLSCRLAGAIKWWSQSSYVVLDCEAKDGIESTDSKPILLEDQRKELEDIAVDEREAFYHATT